ncbi:MAG TPA: Ig-like domain-containing protein, partial [Acidobacteriota bacterium]|nr:Ig-like domain-containing protein [Acidobacteriota bacterium]
MKVFFPLAKRSFSLALFLLIGFCLWFTSAQPHISAQATPQISTVSIKNTTLLVKGQNLTAAAIEVDGVRLDDTKAAASGKKLKSKQGGTLAPGSYIVTVRTQSNQRSAPVIFDNQVSQPPKVTLALTAVSVQLPAGTTLQVTATARDAAGGELTGVNYTWQSTNPAVATVSPTGVVSGLAEGTTQVVVSALRNEALLEIKVLGGESGTPASITVIPANPVLNETETLQLKAEVRDASGNVVADAPVTWSSDNTSQVAIDAGGTVQAVKRGFAAVTAKSGTLQTIVSVAVVKVESGNPASS